MTMMLIPDTAWYVVPLFRMCMQNLTRNFQSGAISDTASISSSIFKYRVENGRTYHAYKAGCE
jgi:hypothetical protein